MSDELFETEGELVSAAAEGKVTVSVSRTVSIKQYEPMNVFASMSVFQNTSDADVAALAQRMNGLIGVVFEQVASRSDELTAPLIETARTSAGSATVSATPAPRAAQAPRPAAAPRAASPARGDGDVWYETVVLSTREGEQREYNVKHFIGQTKGDERVSVKYDDIADPKARKVFQPYVGKNGEITALKALEQAVYFNGGIFTKDDKFGKRTDGGADLRDNIVAEEAPAF